MDWAHTNSEIAVLTILYLLLILRVRFVDKHGDAWWQALKCSHLWSFNGYFGSKHTPCKLLGTLRWQASTLYSFKGHFGNKQAHCMNPNKEYRHIDLDCSWATWDQGLSAHDAPLRDSILECMLSDCNWVNQAQLKPAGLFTVCSSATRAKVMCNNVLTSYSQTH